MQKLALYFLTQDGGPRILDAEHQPTVAPGIDGWLVGRSAAHADIVFSTSRNPDYVMVSKIHAVISARPTGDATAGGTLIYRWTVIDWGDRGAGSTNGIFLSRDGQRPYRVQPGVEFEVFEGDRIQFGCPAAAVKMSFDIDETDSNEDENDSGPPTEGRVAAVTPSIETSQTSWAEVAQVVLKGPEGVPAAVWWFCLTVAGLAALWIWKHK